MCILQAVRLCYGEGQERAAMLNSAGKRRWLNLDQNAPLGKAVLETRSHSTAMMLNVDAMSH